MQGQYAPIRVGRTSIDSALGARQAGFDCLAISGGIFPDSSLMPFYRLDRARISDVQIHADNLRGGIAKSRNCDRMKS